jgi:hypothetical protein
VCSSSCSGAYKGHGMSKRIAVPRASIGVQTIDDDDFITLTDQPFGWSVFGIFTAMVILCRDESSDTLKISTIKRRLGLDSKQIQNTINLISDICESNGNESWIQATDKEIKIRNFYKWNPIEKRGGVREGAGRKPALKR